MALDELMAAPPMSIALAVVVTTAGTVMLESAAALAAVAAGASSGLALLTPEYRAIPPLPVTAPESVQL